MTILPTDYEKEILELHQFFEAWFKANLDKNEENFGRFSDVLSERFAMVTPSGELLDREDILDNVMRGFGTHKDADSPFRIWIKNVNLILQTDDIAIATYEEWQEAKTQVTARISTAFFQRVEGKPNNMVWLRVHETWMKGKAPDAPKS
jgi:hypothetical protein